MRSGHALRSMDARAAARMLRDARCLVALVCLRAVGSHVGAGPTGVGSGCLGALRPPAPPVQARQHLLCLRGGAAREPRPLGAGAEAGRHGGSDDEEQRPRKKRSRRRQLLINMKKDRRPEGAKPKDARKDAQRWESKREADGEQEAAAKAEKSDRQGGPEQGDKEDSATTRRRGSQRYRVMRARWGADLKGDDGRDPAEVVQALKEQEECDKQMQRQKLLLGSDDENSFEWLSLGTALAMSCANRTVTKVSQGLALCKEGDRRPTGHFALWGVSSPDLGADSSSTWGVHIDQLSGATGSLMVGLLLTPFRPAECRADELMSRAWMLSDDGAQGRAAERGGGRRASRACARACVRESVTALARAHSHMCTQAEI